MTDDRRDMNRPTEPTEGDKPGHGTDWQNERSDQGQGSSYGQGQGQGQGQQGGTLDKTWKTTDGDGDSDDVVEPNRQGQEQGTPR
jgi:hypothetical protein